MTAKEANNIAQKADISQYQHIQMLIEGCSKNGGFYINFKKEINEETKNLLIEDGFEINKFDDLTHYTISWFTESIK